MLQQSLKSSHFIMGVWQGHDVDRFRLKTLVELNAQLQRCQQIGAIMYVHENIAAWAPEIFLLPFVQAFRCPIEHTWIPKQYMMLSAIKEFGEVIWLDLDSRQVAPLPDNFWSLLRSRGPVSVKLRQFRSRRCPWRKRESRCLLWTAMVYCREASIIERSIHLLANEDREHRAIYYNEEVALARAIDDYEGGWQGLEHWQANYELPWTETPGELWPAREKIFHCY